MKFGTDTEFQKWFYNYFKVSHLFSFKVGHLFSFFSSRPEIIILLITPPLRACMLLKLVFYI